MKKFKHVFNYLLKVMGIIFVLAIVGGMLIPAFVNYNVRQSINQYEDYGIEEEEEVVTEEDIVSYDSIAELKCDYPHTDYCPNHQALEQEEVVTIKEHKVKVIKSKKKIDKIQKRLEYLEKVKHEKEHMEQQVNQEEIEIMEQRAEVIEEKWELIEDQLQQRGF